MSIQRPRHLVRRQPTGRAFGEDATLITVRTEVNEFGEPYSTETETAITCATAPASSGDARVRELAEGGVELSSMRMFWLPETPRPVVYEDTDVDGSVGDIIVWPRVDGERYRVRVVANWGGFVETITVRIETQ